MGKSWENIYVGQVEQGERAWEGKSIAAVARLRGEDPWTTFFELSARFRVNVNPESMDERQKRLALAAPFVALCTDSEPLDPARATGAHPRAFGAFPRLLARYVREEHVLGLEDAVRRMTSLAANRLSLRDRGRIAPGMAADLVVFDPDTIQDTATFTAPISLPRGIDYVIVNGQVAMDHGRWTGAKAGQLLRPQR